MFFEEPAPASKLAVTDFRKRGRAGHREAVSFFSSQINNTSNPAGPVGIGQQSQRFGKPNEAIMSTMFGSGKKKAKVRFFVARDGFGAERAFCSALHGQKGTCACVLRTPDL